MRNYLTILLIIATSPVISQKKLDGTFYKLKSSENYEYIKFNQNGSFEHKISGGDVGDPEPYKGNFSINGNKLILDYNNFQSRNYGFDKRKIWRNIKDSISIHFKIMDYEGTPIQHAWINDENGRRAIKTDQNGNATFKSKKNNDSLIYIISWVGFEAYDLQIKSNYNCNIEVYLADDLQDIPIRNQIDTLIIKEIKPTYFITESNLKWEKSEQEY